MQALLMTVVKGAVKGLVDAEMRNSASSSASSGGGDGYYVANVNFQSNVQQSFWDAVQSAGQDSIQ